MAGVEMRKESFHKRRVTMRETADKRNVWYDEEYLDDSKVNYYIERKRKEYEREWRRYTECLEEGVDIG